MTGVRAQSRSSPQTAKASFPKTAARPKKTHELDPFRASRSGDTGRQFPWPGTGLAAFDLMMTDLFLSHAMLGNLHALMLQAASNQICEDGPERAGPHATKTKPVALLAPLSMGLMESHRRSCRSRPLFNFDTWGLTQLTVSQTAIYR